MGPAGLLLALCCQQADLDPQIAECLREFEALPDRVTPAVLQSSPAVRRLVVMHRAAIPGLTKTMQSAASWKARLASAYAIKEMGYVHLLHASTADDNPMVRNFARAAARYLPQPSWAHSAPVPYEIEPALRKEVWPLAEARVLLSAPEQAERVRHIARDLGAGRWIPDEEGEVSERSIAVRIAGEHPDAAVAALLASADTQESGEGYWNVLQALWELSLPRVVFSDATMSAARPFVEVGLRHAEPLVRAMAILAAGSVVPLDELANIVSSGLRDPSERVQSQALTVGCTLVGRLEDEGRIDGADRVMADLCACADSGSDSTRYMVRYTRERLEGARKDIRARALRVVDGAVEWVDRWEHEEAMRRFGKPYVTRAQFDEIRALDLERKRAANAPSARTPDVSEPEAAPLRPAGTPTVAARWPTAVLAAGVVAFILIALVALRRRLP